MNINSICVCGAGTMGTGIAQVSAQSGFHTILLDLNVAVLANARTNLENSLQFLVERKKITKEDSAKILRRILFTNDLQACLADVFIEAIVEKTELKIALFNQLAELNHSECVFATNTSSLSIASIAKSVQCPERVIGIHFFNPAPVMKLVEIVSTSYTNHHTKEIALALVKEMGKTAVTCVDSPGFIVNRVARPFYIECLRIAEEGKLSYEQIDRLLEASGFRMGPFKLMDLIGNDINYAVSNSVFEQLGKPERLRPSYLQKEKVDKNELGQKTGKGYYDYRSPTQKLNH